MTDWRIPLARPDINADDRAAVDRVLRSGQLSRGPAVEALEAAFRELTGASEAVAVSTGTAALTLGLLALELPHDARCIMSPFTVPASANAALAAGLRVCFADIDAQSLAVAPAAAAALLREGDVLMTVHAFGHPAPVAQLQAACDAAGALHCEDTCEALGTRQDGRHVGRLGRFGTFGFYPNKQVTTGEGGMLITDDPALAAKVVGLRNHGRTMDGSWLDQEAVGFNHRLSDLNAALGGSQLARFDATLARRRQLAAWYAEELTACSELKLPQQRPHFADTSLFAYVPELVAGASDRRDALVAFLAERGIQAGRYFAPLHLQPGLARLGGGAGDFPVTERVASSTIALPYYTDMTRAACAEVGAAVRAFFGRQP